MVEVTPNPDSTVKHIETDSGKPTKVFYNWLQNITRIIGGFGDIVTHDASEFAPASGVPACFSVHKSGNQTGIANNTLTALTFDTEEFDVGSHFASDVWTPPAGKVLLSAVVLATPVGGSFTAANFQSVSITKNGSVLKSVSTYEQANSNGSGWSLTIIDSANGSDTFGVKVLFQITGGSGVTVLGGDASTYFMGHWISA